MKKRLGLLAWAAVAMVALGSWGGSTAQAADNCTATFTSGAEGTFPGAFKYDNSTKVLTVDLSGIPKDAVIFRAELILNGLQQFQVRPTTPTKVFAEADPEKPLKLIGPRYVSLDALDAVKAAVASGKPLTLKLECTLSGAKRLEVSYVGGKAKAEAVPAVSNVKVLHRAGQSLIVFTEPKLPWTAAVPAPFDGTIASIEVKPDQAVKKGDVLVKMDTTELAKQLEAAKTEQASLQKEMDAAKAEDPPAAAKANDLKAKLDKAAATIKTVEAKLAKAELKSPAVGKIVGDPAAKQGAAIKAGQAVVEVAGELDPTDYPAIKLGADVSRVRQEAAKSNPGLAFRIWRSGERITPATIAKAELVGECGLFTGWNDGYHQDKTGGNPPIRYRVTDGGEEVPWGTGIYAHNPPTKKAGKAFYAVTVAVNGEEDLSKLTDANTTAEAVEETVGAGVPILQWKEVVKEFNFRSAPNSHIVRLIYTRWEAWPNSSTPNNPIDYLMACSDELMPEKMPTRELNRMAFRTDPAQAALHLHCWGANLNGGYYWWYNAHRGAVLLASNQIPYDWWTGYHEANGTSKTFGDGFVHPFTMTRLFSFLDWAAKQHAEAPEAVRAHWPKFDLTRTLITGMSMGGAGAPMYPIR